MKEIMFIVLIVVMSLASVYWLISWIAILIECNVSSSSTWYRVAKKITGTAFFICYLLICPILQAILFFIWLLM